jgi:Ca2+-binding RTX toxin-like protein
MAASPSFPSLFPFPFPRNNPTPPPQTVQPSPPPQTVQSDSPQTIYGTEGDDRLNASSSYKLSKKTGDTLYGLGGNDFLRGGYGNDTLIGGAGDDLLNGGEGDNILTGGSGKDKFELFQISAFSTGNSSNTRITSNDTITDFTPGEDKLKIVNGVNVIYSPSSMAPKNLDIVDSDSAAELSASPVVYNKTNGKLFSNPNGVSAGFTKVYRPATPTTDGLLGQSVTEGGLFATLEGAPNLSAADLTIF